MAASVLGPREIGDSCEHRVRQRVLRLRCRLCPIARRNPERDEQDDAEHGSAGEPPVVNWPSGRRIQAGGRPFGLTQIRSRIADVAQPFPRVFLEAALQQAANCGRRARGKSRPVGLATQDTRNGVGNRVAAERAATGEHLVEHRAECPDVGALVDRASSRLLGAHVCRRSEHHALNGRLERCRRICGCRGILARCLGEAEVQQLHDALRRQLDIRRFEIPVDDATLVRGVERLAYLTRDREGLLQWQWSR